MPIFKGNVRWWNPLKDFGLRETESVGWLFFVIVAVTLVTVLLLPKVRKNESPDKLAQITSK